MAWHFRYVVSGIDQHPANVGDTATHKCWVQVSLKFLEHCVLYLRRYIGTTQFRGRNTCTSSFTRFFGPLTTSPFFYFLGLAPDLFYSARKFLFPFHFRCACTFPPRRDMACPRFRRVLERCFHSPYSVAHAIKLNFKRCVPVHSSCFLFYFYFYQEQTPNYFYSPAEQLHEVVSARCRRQGSVTRESDRKNVYMEASFAIRSAPILAGTASVSLLSLV